MEENRLNSVIFFAFIDFENDEVEVFLCLRDGQKYTRESGGRTEEGYSYTTTTWSRCGDMLRCETHTEASDCDGRLDTEDIHECPINQIDENGRPAWVHESGSQRDYAAEAMNY